VTPQTPLRREMSHWDLANRDSRYAASTFEAQFETNFSPQGDRFRQMHNRGFSTSMRSVPVA